MKDKNEIKDIVRKMSLEDKTALCEGADFWTTRAFEKYGIPSMFMCDGPHGLRKQSVESDMLGINQSYPATCFPAAVTTAGSWNEELLEEIGKAIAEEAKDQGVGLVLGPGANSKRNPLCGRNFEYFSEDPVLAGRLAASYIRGMEAMGVGASLKHFAANSQEHCRFVSDGIMDERTLREVYLQAFEIAVKEGRPSTVMCAYPKLNGVHCSDNGKLLTDILRKEWGFEGLVVTDWGAMDDRREAFRAGCDLNMPGGSDYMFKEVIRAVKSGQLEERYIDECAERVLRLVLRAEDSLKEKAECDYALHHSLARKAACEGAVLLKNDGGLLPLKKDAKIAVIGHMAKEMRYQGAGSSHINAAELSQPLEHLPGTVYIECCDEQGDLNDEMLTDAVIIARKSDAAVVFAGLPDRYESEGFDRSDMKMPEGHVRMIEAVCGANPNTVVVLFCGAPVECPWADKAKAILYMGLPGEAGGEAAADLLYGREVPSGKLAESWPFCYEDCVSSSYYGKGKDALYLEGIYTGYRYYDKAGKDVRWPFGYGLSYTTFELSSLRKEENRVSVTVTNTGSCAGAEVVQLYVELPKEGIHKPLRQLRGFRKVFLKPGESREIDFVLKDRDFAFWQDAWKVQKGEYIVCIGTSCKDLPLKTAMFKEGADPEAPEQQKGSWYESLEGVPSLADLEAAAGIKYEEKKVSKGSYTLENTVSEMKDHSLVIKIMYKALSVFIGRSVGEGKDSPEYRMMMESSAGAPLRSLMI
ncbi:MAG: glycoside hydrolase family 3 C-terminal domain-containing protein, partial [Firmicutes bacterium]|nr:glycoside hydrolase family 3 C-terminal domain-containing protein [Bacillota bacterium]